MFIRPMSDLHGEFSIFNIPPLETDHETVLILSGDICLADTRATLLPLLDAASPRFANILLIPGNHEYYHTSLLRGDAKLEDLCSDYLNVFHMNKKAMTIKGVTFIGATLWTDLRNNDPMIAYQAESEMNDYRLIRTGDTPTVPYKRRLKAYDTVRVNSSHREFIRNELIAAKNDGRRSVVFTHHPPSFATASGQYGSSPLDYAYHNTGLDDLILDYGPEYWFHGHTHHSARVKLGNTEIIANCRGYSRNPDGWESCSGFDPNLTIEL